MGSRTLVTSAVILALMIGTTYATAASSTPKKPQAKRVIVYGVTDGTKGEVYLGEFVRETPKVHVTIKQYNFNKEEYTYERTYGDRFSYIDADAELFKISQKEYKLWNHVKVDDQIWWVLLKKM